LQALMKSVSLPSVRWMVFHLRQTGSLRLSLTVVMNTVGAKEEPDATVRLAIRSLGRFSSSFHFRSSKGVALHRRVRQGLAREDPANGAGRVHLRVDAPHNQKLFHGRLVDGTNVDVDVAEVWRTSFGRCW
jgi:hypothetical protein